MEQVWFKSTGSLALEYTVNFWAFSDVIYHRLVATRGPIPTSHPRKGIATVTISMHQASVSVFTQFLGNLSDLLDRAADHAELRKIDPAILLNTRLYPNMYNLTRQVGEA